MSLDPWERREREKTRRTEFKKGRDQWDLFAWIAESARPLILLLGLALLLGAEVPALGGGLRGALAIGGTVALLSLAALTRTWQRPLRAILLTPPGIAVLLMIAWGGVAFFLSPFRAQAGGELLRLVGGAAAFLLAAHALDSKERATTVGGLLTIGCGISLYDFTQMAKVGNLNRMVKSVATDYSVFGTHENVGSLLALLLPLALALAAAPKLEERRRWAVQAATLVLGFAWIAARCRSAWIGGGIALVALAILLWRSPGRQTSRARTDRERLSEALGSPLPLLAAAVLVMAIGGGFATFFSQRAATMVNVLDDSSLSTRVTMWEGAARMAAQRPLTGWGLGSFPIRQGDWTHLGSPAIDVLRDGATHENIAHNFYVQWAAEAGGVGLALHVFVMALWLLATLRGLGRTLPPAERTLAIGALAAVLGASLDAAASPAYQFHGVWAVLWTLMGLGTAAIASAEDRTPKSPLLLYLISGALGILAALGVIGWGRSLGATSVPRGQFVLIADPPGPSAPPGQLVTIRAEFTDGRGKIVNSSPGTTWEVPSERESGALKGGVGALLTKENVAEAVIRVTLPEKPGAIVQIMARYSDRNGRPYAADQIFLIRK